MGESNLRDTSPPGHLFHLRSAPARRVTDGTLPVVLTVFVTTVGRLASAAIPTRPRWRGHNHGCDERKQGADKE